MMSFNEFAAMLSRAADRVRPALIEAATTIGAVEKKVAVEMIGREGPQWAPLAESTVNEKARLGYVGRLSATDPLLRTGDMRDSIEVEIAPTADGVNVVLGSGDPVAAFQELGTATIPPRPFISVATLETASEAERILGNAAAKLFSED